MLFMIDIGMGAIADTLRHNSTLVELHLGSMETTGNIIGTDSASAIGCMLLMNKTLE